LKNSYYGYTDTTQIQISTSADTVQNPEQLATKYADAIPAGFTTEDYNIPDFSDLPTDFPAEE
jgi:hypothetical protein